jgi:hypothetical protein
MRRDAGSDATRDIDLIIAFKERLHSLVRLCRHHAAR